MRFYLNPSNSKWIRIGIAPDRRGVPEITNFEIRMFIGGDRCPDFEIEDRDEFIELLDAIKNVSKVISLDKTVRIQSYLKQGKN